MKKKTLNHLAMPHTTAQFAREALGAARRRWLQTRPGHGPFTAPGEEKVTHYLGPEDETVLGAEPDSPIEAALRRETLHGRS